MYFKLHLISRIVLLYSRYNPDSEHFAPNTKHVYRWFLQEARSIILCNKDLGLLSDSLRSCRETRRLSLSLSSLSFSHIVRFLRTECVCPDTTHITLRATLISNMCNLNTESSRQSPMRSLTIGDFAYSNSLRFIWYIPRGRRT